MDSTLGQGYEPQASGFADNSYLDLKYSGYHKKSHSIIIIVHLSHYLFSDLTKAYSEFSKSVPVMS